MTAHKREIAVALDTHSKDDFFNIYSKLKDLDLVFKVGLKIFPRLDVNDWKKFHNKKLFIDAKLHDIPTQVADAVAAYGDLGARYLTVHLSGGGKMLELAQKKAEEYKIVLLGVSALTSLSNDDLKEIGFSSDSKATVTQLVRLGINSGLSAFVMSPWELEIKSKYPDIFCVTPGISLETGTSQSDQIRTTTLQEALKMGSDMPVIGRAILQSPSPHEAALKALEMLVARQ